MLNNKLACKHFVKIVTINNIKAFYSAFQQFF